jgi:isoquinoline 1-oxidoreductase subunit alpha
MITLYINGSEHQVDVSHDKPLLWVLRDDLRMTGTKFGGGAVQGMYCAHRGRPVPAGRDARADAALSWGAKRSWQ